MPKIVKTKKKEEVKKIKRSLKVRYSTPILNGVQAASNVLGWLVSQNETTGLGGIVDCRDNQVFVKWYECNFIVYLGAYQPNNFALANWVRHIVIWVPKAQALPGTYTYQTQDILGSVPMIALFGSAGSTITGPIAALDDRDPKFTLLCDDMYNLGAIDRPTGIAYPPYILGNGVGPASVCVRKKVMVNRSIYFKKAGTPSGGHYTAGTDVGQIAQGFLLSFLIGSGDTGSNALVLQGCEWMCVQ